MATTFVPGVCTSTLNAWENHHFSPDVRFVPKIIDFLGYNPFDPPSITFPARLKAARIGAGYTRRQLGAQIGVHTGTVAKWERGEARPVLKLWGRLQTWLGVSTQVKGPDRFGRRELVRRA